MAREGNGDKIIERGANLHLRTTIEETKQNLRNYHPSGADILQDQPY